MKINLKQSFALPLLLAISVICLFLIKDAYKLSIRNTFVIQPTPYHPVHRNYSHHQSQIHVISIINTYDVSNYDTAIKTVRCYAMQRGYKYHLLNIMDYPNILMKCPFKDFMFRRHCFLSLYVGSINENDFVVFVDADLGIINPNKYIEDYLPQNEEQFLFVQRHFNFEIMAGTFIFKNSIYSRHFLQRWALYDTKKPNSFDGSDNVALHAVLMDLMPLHVQENRKDCEAIWETSKNWGDCSKFVACMRYLFSGQNKSEPIFEKDLSFDDGKVVAFSKTSIRRWMRDLWITESKWSVDDFMIHGLKESGIVKNIFEIPTTFGDWVNPIHMKTFNIEKCTTSRYYQNWLYYSNNYKSSAHVKHKLEVFDKEVGKEYINQLEGLNII
uniref:Nucleotid_trans domain-containing protein n=1 Tax=Rhabditophanes sp. KR3021 TaxID=114890 RepID=A0AC35TYL0_9BILA